MSRYSAAGISIERAATLSNAAIRRLEALGHGNIVTMIGNDYRGWPDLAPSTAS